MSSPMRRYAGRTIIKHLLLLTHLARDVSIGVSMVVAGNRSATAILVSSSLISSKRHRLSDRPVFFASSAFARTAAAFDPRVGFLQVEVNSHSALISGPEKRNRRIFDSVK
jgi:hypothetical protein